jgi:poly(3-hydroxybutyrate) depolymerase
MCREKGKMVSRISVEENHAFVFGLAGGCMMSADFIGK